MRQTAFQKATKRIETDGIKHCFVLYGAMGIVLWRHWNKRVVAIPVCLICPVRCGETAQRIMTAA